MKNQRPRLPFSRSNRMTSVIREEIMNWLGHGFDYSHIVITDIQLTDDCRFARVFFREKFDLSSLEDVNQEAREKMEEEMQHLSGKIRAHLGRVLRLKHTPELRFQYDQGLEQADYIEDLLRKT